MFTAFNGSLPGPAPDGQSLVVDLECWVSSDGPSVVHPVVIGPDWSIETGHDLDLERIARSLGGHSSCLDLMERVLPAFREGVALNARTVLPALRFHRADGTWAVDDCCECGDQYPTPRFSTVTAAAKHARSPEHLAGRFQCCERVLTRLMRVSERAYGRLRSIRRVDPDWPQGRADREYLWGAGLHPELVRGVRRRYAWSDQDAPRDLCVGVAYLNPGERFLRSLIAVGADPGTVAWAAWTERSEDRLVPHARADLLRSGATPADLVAVLDSYLVQDVRDLEAHSDLSSAEAVAVLAAWVRAGCRPSVPDLAPLDRVLGGLRRVPTGQELDDLLTTFRGRRRSRTEAGLILALAGHEEVARTLMLRGIRCLTEAIDHLELDGQPAGSSDLVEVA